MRVELRRRRTTKQTDAGERESGSRRRRDRGATVVEYALGLTLIAGVAITGLQYASDQTDDVFDRVINDVGTPAEVAPATTVPPPPTTARPPCRRWCR